MSLLAGFVRRKNLGLAAACYALASTPALAFDAGDFLKSLEERAKSAEATLTYDLESSTADSLTLSNVSVISKDGKKSMKIEEIIFTDAREVSDGVFEIGAFSASGLEQTRSHAKTTSILRAQSVGGTGIRFKPATDQRESAAMPAFSGLNLGQVAIERNGKNREFSATTQRISATDFSYTNENRFSVGALNLQPVTGTAVMENGRGIDFQFGGFSVSDFERTSLMGFEVGDVKIGKFSANGKDPENRQVDIQFAGMSMNNFFVADPADENRPLFSEKPLDAKVGQFSVSLDNKPFFGWAGGESDYRYDVATSTGIGGYSFRDMFFDLGVVPIAEDNRQAVEKIKELGYERISMNMGGKGSWNTANGDATLDNFRFEFADAGAIDISARISGYTERVAREFSRIANQLGAEEDPQKQQAMNMQLLATMAVLGIQELEFTVEDASLLGKILAVQSKEIGRAPEELAAIVSPSVLLMMTPLGVPDLTAAVATALETFMQGNKSITAIAKPEGGLVVTEIIALASGVQAGSIQPAQLVERLNLQVTAE